MPSLADVRRQVEAQARELRRTVEELPRAHRDLQADLLAQAYGRIVAISPVRTGAYRAEHVIELGEGDAPGALLYEAPNRPGPDAQVSVDAGAPLAPPDPRAARAALDGLAPFETVQIVNRRSYAPDVEFGTSRQEPLMVYGRAAQATEFDAQRADIPAERLRRGRE